MDESFKQRLVECGADVESTVRRFMGNEAMYEKFLKNLRTIPIIPVLRRALRRGTTRKHSSVPTPLRAYRRIWGLTRFTRLLRI